jgi:hypothetical protein
MYRPISLARRKGGLFVTEENEPVVGLGREKASRREPAAADNIAILDYVMLDFVDEPFALRKTEQRRTVTEPWRDD